MQFKKQTREVIALFSHLTTMNSKNSFNYVPIMKFQVAVGATKRRSKLFLISSEEAAH